MSIQSLERAISKSRHGDGGGEGLIQGFLTVAPLTFGVGGFPIVGCSPGHWGMFSGISALPTDANSTSPISTL